MVINKTLANRYHITSLIGEGGMAQVYRAEDTLLGRSVAIKVLRDQFAADPSFLERFKHEARATAALAHPNVVGVFDVGEDGGKHYIVMEYVDGSNLKDQIRQQGPLPVQRAVEIGIQVCAGVQAAHNHGVTHRDVKPQNILLGRNGQVKITDFGIALAGSSMTTTATGQVLGSVHYLSPEQARGRQATPASDVYQIGVVLYEMLTGQVPFEAETPMGVAVKHAQEMPTPPHVVNQRVPIALSNIVMRALSKRPEDRFPSVAELGEELQHYENFVAGKTTAFQVPPEPAPIPRGRSELRQPVRPAPIRRRHGVDWVLVGFGTLAIIAILGLLLLGAAVYYSYTTPTDLPIPQRIIRGLQQLGGAASASGEPAASPTASASPTATPLPRVGVPRLIGLSQENARIVTESNHLVYVEAGQEYSDTEPAGNITRQSIPPGETAEVGTRLNVIVSLGKRPVVVPNVTNARFDDAAKTLEDAGFVVRREEAWHPSVPVGSVIRQSPAGNSELPPGGEVVVTVSRGPEQTQVPNVIGRPEAEAKQMIERAGLKNFQFVNYQGHSDLPGNVLNQVCVGCVLSTTPAPGEMVPPGTEIKMAVRKD